MVQECTRAYEGPGVQESQIYMLITNCRTGSLNLPQRRKAMNFWLAYFDPLGRPRDPGLEDEEHVILRRSNIATGGRCHLHFPSTSSCKRNRHRSLELELPLALSIGVRDIGSAVEVGLHCPLSSCHSECHCENLPKCNRPWSFIDFGSQLVKAAQLSNVLSH